MTSELWKEWLEEERKEGKLEGLKEGELKEASNKVIAVLINRFGLIGEDIITEVNAISNKEVLDQLFNKSLNIDSLEDFEKILGKIN